MAPWFAAAGLAAVGIAVWMHLYERVASRRMKVSSLRLVPETKHVANNRKRMRHWPLFLLRALGVILLGLAFARPGILGGGHAPAGGREVVVFVVDRSASMGMRSTDGTTAWEESLKLIEKRLDGLHPQSRVRLFCFPPMATGDDWSSPSAMRKLVEGLTPSQLPGRPFDALRDAAEALARFRSDMPESLEVIGDLQKQGWQDIDTLTLPEELRVNVSQTGDAAAPNRGLALQVRGSDQLRRAVVTVSGGTTPLVVRDRAGADGKLMEQEIPLPDEALELPYRSDTSGWVRREVSFRKPSDGLVEDDRLFDSFFVAPEVPVDLLEPDLKIDAFLQKTFFLGQALRPTVGDAASDSRFVPKVVSVADAIAALGELKGREAVVVIPPLATWPTDLPDAIDAFVREGGSVVFFAGPDIQPATYTSAWQKLLPALPGEILAVEDKTALAPIGALHPIWGGFSNELRQSMRKAPLKKRFALTVSAESEVMARYADEVPLVVRRPLGSGRVIFVNTSPDRAWGDWSADGSLFVPTIHMLMAAVLPPTPQMLRNSPGAGIVGVPFDVRIDPALAGAALKSGAISIKADKQGWVRGLQFDKAGLFDLIAEDGRVVRPVAVNFPPEESRREFFLPTILQRQIESRRRTAGGAEEAPRINLATESGWWRWILGLLAVVWLAEAWFALPRVGGKTLKGQES